MKRNLSSTQKLLWQYLEKIAIDDKPILISNREFANEIGCSSRTIISSLNGLQEIGLIKISHNMNSVQKREIKIIK